jgi:serine/threonine protein kinase/alpha-tubulin suppressor-like RCC1 family protein
MPPNEDNSSDVVGKQIGNYTATKLLGKGSMGEVYEAAHPILDKQVAIKVLSEDLSSYPELVSRFKREARAIARIKHKAIVQAFDFGNLDDGRQYYVMERLKGSNLAVYMTAKGPVPWEEAMTIAVPLLEGLAAAHEAGFIHRDIKPDNIFITRLEDGTLYPKIIDFGIAKLRDPDDNQDSVVTRIDAVMGTPLYMSPEQAPGSTEDVGAWSDIYSAAATLYHMIAGKPPFYSDNPLELMLMHSWQPPPPLYEHRPDLSLEISDAIMKALAKKPSERYPSMLAFSEGLKAASEGKGPPAGVAPTSRTDPPEKVAGVETPPETPAETPAESAATEPTVKKRKTAEASVVATMNEVKAPTEVGDLQADPDEEESLEMIAEAGSSTPVLTSLSGAASEKVINARMATGTYYAVQKSKTPYIIAGIVAGLLVLGAIAFFVLRGMGGGESTPAPKPKLFRQVSSMTRHTCGLHRTDGSIWCWGRNNYGQLGNRTTHTSTKPVRVSALAKGRAVAAGGRHTCGLTNDQTVWCWGKNSSGQLGIGTTQNQSHPVKVVGLKKVVALDAGNDHTCAITADDNLWCWGDNRAGQLGRTAGGQLSKPVRVEGLSGVRSVSLGGFHTCVVTKAGKVLCWGKNDVGQLGLGDTQPRDTPTQLTSLGGMATISAGGAHSCALGVGALYCWGNNASGQIGDGTSRLRFSPVKLPKMKNIVKVTAGGGYLGGHTCAMDVNGSAWCWGNNLSGQLGHSQPKDAHLRPTRLDLKSKVESIEASGRHTCAVDRAGQVLCWGRNTDGQLGDATSNDRIKPTKISP